jgi:hypothetical protein
VDWLAQQAQRIAGLPAGDAPADLSPIVGAAVVGAVVAALPSLWRHWVMGVLSFLILVASGGLIGIWARRQEWGATTFVRQSLLAAFVTATTLLVIGTICRNSAAVLYGGVFVIAAAANLGLGLLSMKLLRTR